MFKTQISGAIMAYLRIEPMNCIIKGSEGKGGLYLGNVYAAQNIDLLTKNDIGSVLTMADLDISYKDFPFINHKLIECHDIETQDLTPYFHEVADFIEQELTKTNVFVHCFAGVSRSTSAICAYFIKHKGYDFNKAFSFIKKKRIVAFPNLGFQRQLRAFEQLYKNTYPNSKNGTTSSNYRPPVRSFSSSGKTIDQNRLKNRLLMFQNKNSHWLNENQIQTLTNVMKHAQNLQPSPTNNELQTSKPPKPSFKNNNKIKLNFATANPSTNAILYSNQNSNKTKQQRLKEIQENLGLDNNFEISKKPLTNNNYNNNNYNINSSRLNNQNNNKNYVINQPKKKLPIISKPKNINNKNMY